jgi:hypothetical protein
MVVRQRRGGWSGVLGLMAAAMVIVPLLAGCARPDDAGDPGTAGNAEGAAPDRPAERRMAVEVEGMAEEMGVVLYGTPTGFPLPFTTYVPEDMLAEPYPLASPTTDGGAPGDAPGDGAAGVRFVANYGGHRNDAAAVRLIVARAEATEEELVALLRELGRELGTELVEEPDARFGWSIREFRNVAPASRQAVAEGLMAIGRRDGRLFALALHHPAEYGDGFGPRAGVIMDEWRWEDTAEPLRR